MSNTALDTRDPDAENARPTRTRRNVSLAATGFHELGVAGRRTGVVVQQTARDEDGLEDFDAFFNSSPAAVAAKAASPAPRSSENRPIPKFIDPTGGILLSSNSQISNIHRFRTFPETRSPIPTHLGTSPRRPSSLKRQSAQYTNSTPIPQSGHSPRLRSSVSQVSVISPSTHASSTDVARKLDFASGNARLSTGPVTSTRRTSPLKRGRTNEYGESEDDEDEDGEPGLVRPSPTKRRATEHPPRIDLPSTAPPFDHDLIPTTYSDEEEDQDQPARLGSFRSQADPAPPESVYDFPVSDDEMVAYASSNFPEPMAAKPLTGTSSRESGTKPASQSKSKSPSNNEPDDDVDPGFAVPPQVEEMDILTQELTPETQNQEPGPLESSRLETDSNGKGTKSRRKRPRIHPKDRNPNARVSSVSSFLDESNKVDDGTKKKAGKTDPGDTKTKSSQKTFLQTSKPPVSRSQKSSASTKTAASSLTSSKNPLLPTGPSERKPGTRSLQILRPELENQDGTRTTRSGRVSIRPVSWWCGERVERSYDGTIQAVTRAEEVPVGNASGRQRSKPKPKPKPSKSSASKGKAKAVKSESLPDIEEDADQSALQDEEPEEEWEAGGRVLSGYFPEYASNDTELKEADIAFSRKSLITQPARTGPYSYAKYLRLPFMGAGLIDLPSGGYKASANSGPMHMVFFVHSGRVWARVGDLPVPHEGATEDPSTEDRSQQLGCEFTIGAGGLWVVPRGTKYSMANDDLKPARLFFFQACEVPADILSAHENKAAQATEAPATGTETKEDEEGREDESEHNAEGSSQPLPSRTSRAKKPHPAAARTGPILQESSHADSSVLETSRPRSRNRGTGSKPVRVENTVSSDEGETFPKGKSDPKQGGSSSSKESKNKSTKATRISTVSGRGNRGRRPARGRVKRQ